MVEVVAYFSVKSIGLSRCNGRKPCSLLDAARHNLREIQAEQGAKGHIDPRHSRQNTIMAGPSTAAAVHALSVALLAPVDTARLKRDHCQAIEAVFSLPSGAGIDAAAYFARCLEWLAQALPLPLLNAVVHHDEATPHLHALLLPVRHGRHVGSAPIARPELKRMRDSFFAQVAGPFGLKREGAKLRGTVKEWAVTAVLRACEAEGWRVATGPLWPVLRAAIVRDPTEAMLALHIDANGIRPADETPLRQAQPNPIGLAQTSIGLHNEGQIVQALSCVGLGPAHHPQSSPQAIATVADLWAVVGCKLPP
ncbi:MAG: plasmid recombination protein, partial [Burkholderiaceae bacterium]